MSTRIALDSLGCKLNQAETESLARQFAEAGYYLVSSVDEADIYVLNTCTVTHIADSKSRHLLRLAHQRNPHALVVATGCYAQRASEELARIEGVGLILSNEEKPDLLQRLEEAVCLDTLGHGTGILTGSCNVGFRTRVFVKVQDGCNDFCAYCIVPLVRGREKNVPAEQVLAEVKSHVADGYKEVVVTGTKIGSYESGGVHLKGLIQRILSDTQAERLRLSSIQPQEISSDLIELWHDKRLCRHFHLSLQSGSDAVLTRMRRRYSTADYQQAVSQIRALVPDAAITTDVIVGFPGETDNEFEESYRFCQQMEFARIHVFAYSRRQGTQAARMPGQIEAQVKKRRGRIMMSMAEKSTQAFRRRFTGRTMPVLWEKQSDDGIWTGLTDNYIRVHSKSNQDLTNKLLPVKVT